MIMAMTELVLRLRSSSSDRPPSPMVPILRLSRFRSMLEPIPSAPMAAAAEGLSKFMDEVDAWLSPVCCLRICEAAGDFLNCWGDVREPAGGEKAVWTCEAEKGVDTGGVGAAPAICEGVRPCCEGVRPCCEGWRSGVDMVSR